MTRRQRGVTTIGWIFLLIPVGLVLYAGIRVAPEYMNYYKVLTAMKETASQLKGSETLSPQEILTPLERRFDVGYIDSPTIQEMQVKKGAKGWEIIADYEKTAPLFGNLHLLMAFNTTVVIN
jgi:hypothetical protein